MKDNGKLDNYFDLYNIFYKIQAKRNDYKIRSWQVSMA